MIRLHVRRRPSSHHIEERICSRRYAIFQLRSLLSVADRRQITNRIFDRDTRRFRSRPVSRTRKRAPRAKISILIAEVAVYTDEEQTTPKLRYAIPNGVQQFWVDAITVSRRTVGERHNRDRKSVV